LFREGQGHPTSAFGFHWGANEITIRVAATCRTLSGPNHVLTQPCQALDGTPPRSIHCVSSVHAHGLWDTHPTVMRRFPAFRIRAMRHRNHARHACPTRRWVQACSAQLLTYKASALHGFWFFAGESCLRPPEMLCRWTGQRLHKTTTVSTTAFTPHVSFCRDLRVASYSMSKGVRTGSLSFVVFTYFLQY
jgi:hypothetical protein